MRGGVKKGEIGAEKGEVKEKLKDEVEVDEVEEEEEEGGSEGVPVKDNKADNDCADLGRETPNRNNSPAPPPSLLIIPSFSAWTAFGELPGVGETGLGVVVARHRFGPADRDLEVVTNMSLGAGLSFLLPSPMLFGSSSPPATSIRFFRSCFSFPPPNPSPIIILPCPSPHVGDFTNPPSDFPFLVPFSQPSPSPPSFPFSRAPPTRGRFSISRRRAGQERSGMGPEEMKGRGEGGSGDSLSSRCNTCSDVVLSDLLHSALLFLEGGGGERERAKVKWRWGVVGQTRVARNPSWEERMGEEMEEGGGRGEEGGEGE